jgi:hypothetical protein
MVAQVRERLKLERWGRLMGRFGWWAVPASFTKLFLDQPSKHPPALMARPVGISIIPLNYHRKMGSNQRNRGGVLYNVIKESLDITLVW